MPVKKKRMFRKAITERELRGLMKSAAEDYSSMSDWAKSHKITPQAASAFLNKVQGAGLQIPKALGYRPVTVYVPVEED